MEAHERYTGPIVPGIRFRVGDGTEYTVGLFDPTARYAVCWDQGGADTEAHFRMERRVTHVPPEVLADGWGRLRKVGVNDLQKNEEWYCLDMSCNARAVYGVRVGGDGACEAHARSQGVFRKEGFPEQKENVPAARAPGLGWRLAPVGRTCSSEEHSGHARRSWAVYLKADFSGIASCGSCAVRMGVFGDPDVAELRATKRVTLAPGWVATSSDTHLCQAEGCRRMIEFATNDGRMLWSCSVHAASFGVFGPSVRTFIAKQRPVIDAGPKVTNVFEPIARPIPCPCTRALPDLCWIHVAPRKKPRPPVSRATIVGTYHASMEKLSATGREKFETGISPLGRATNIDRERIPPTLTELACARVWKGYRNGSED